MKKVGLLFFFIALFLCISSLEAFADIGPKPSLSITVNNYNGKSCYLDLFSNNGAVKYDSLNYKYSESYKELPIYKYNVDGWLATHIRSGILWGDLKPTIVTETLENGESSYSLSSGFSYFGIPKVFKVIIQLESGELYVSTSEYNVTEYNQSTTIDFEKDMIKVTTLDDNCKISGYVMPEVVTASKPSPELNQGFTVEAAGTGLKVETDNTGYFEITGIAKKDEGYKLYISKPGYLKRTVDVTAVQSDLALNSKETPVLIWPGDISKDGIQDGAVNLADIICVASAFNSVSGDDRYVKEYDFNIDGRVNMSDIMFIAQHFNKAAKDYPACILPGLSPTPRPTLKPTPIIDGGRVEAENMVFNKYIEDNFEGVLCAKLDPDSTLGTLSGRFNGAYGFYDISIRYLDEAGGQSEMGLYVQNSRLEGRSWVLNEDDSTWKIKTIKDVLLDKGYPIMLQANKNGEENNRVDYIEFKLTSVPTSTPTPALTTFVGRLVWNDIEGGFYGVVGENEAGETVKYDIGKGLPGIEECFNTMLAVVEITGYPRPGMFTTHMWGTAFELVSYKSIDPKSFNQTVVTPTPAPAL